MPDVRGELKPQRLPVESGPKCQTSTVSLLSSTDAMDCHPVWLAAPVAGSHMALIVKLTSLVVSGCPSDHLRPDFSLSVTSMWVSSTFLTSPLVTVGTSDSMSGRALFCGSKAYSDAHSGPVATSWVVAAVDDSTFRSWTGSQSE